MFLKALATSCVMTACATGAAAPAGAASVVSQVGFAACANANSGFGQPIGASVGNAGTRDAAISFRLLDPTDGNNFWLGAAGGSIDIRVSVASPTAVYMLMNTFYGQNGIANATVVLKGTDGAGARFQLLGNTTIRDYNNWVWTNTINGTTAQEWWTNNRSPKPQDQSKRLDAHRFALGSAFVGKTLTDIIVVAPANAGTNYMEPVLFAVDVQHPGSATIRTTCTSK